MAAPQPLPRKKSTGNAFTSDSTDQESAHVESPALRKSAAQLVHTVEVHSLTENRSASSDNSLVLDKKKKRLKRKGTFSISKKKSDELLKSVPGKDVQNPNDNEKDEERDEKETFSEHSSSSSSNKDRPAPLFDQKKKKKPSGYATETLSEESDIERPPTIPSVHPRSIASLKTSENENSSSNELCLLNKSCNANESSKETENSASHHSSPHPIPCPRKFLDKSIENLLNVEVNKSIPESLHSYCTSSSLDYKDNDALPKQRLKKHRKKKKLPDASSDDCLHNAEESIKIPRERQNQSPLSEDKKIPKSPNTSDFICLTINECDPLQIKDFRTKPYVKIILMDIESGKQKVNSKGEMIEAVSTQPYDYTFQRSSIPHWNEDLIIMEPLDILKNISTILIIGILDDEKNKVIAWGFLKPMAANGATNIGRVLRLQLFKPGKASKDVTLSQIFTWWKSGSHKSYKSTLYMSVNGIPGTMIMENKTNDSNKNVNNQDYPEKSINEVISEKEDTDLEEVKWGRLPSLSCKLPNKYLARLPAGPDGSIAIAYSNSGLFLASANKVAVCIYTFKGRLYLSLQGHHGLVYSLKWSSNDKYLLSASADFTSCVWDISNKILSPIQSVPHPSYVYCCSWLDNNTFATGCFDNDIRIWKIGSTQLYQQASHHKGQINTLLCYENYLLSGDSLGEICLWNWTSEGNLKFVKEFGIREIKGKVINKLSLHPGKKRILVHTRDSVLRMVDITTGAVLHWFQGLVNMKLREDSTFCGCGSLVLAWSEDSTLCVWDSNTGAQAAIFPGLIPDSQPGVVDFHPRDHMMAVSAHSSHTPVLSILVYDRSSNGREVGLVPLTQSIGNISLSSERSSGHSSDKSSESTPKKKEGLLKTILKSKRKNKKESPHLPFMGNSFTNFSHIPSNTSRQLELDDSIPKESRLGDIIKRMDRILTSVSNNSSLYSS